MSLFDDLPEPTNVKVAVEKSPNIDIKRKQIVLENSDICNKKLKIDLISFKSFVSARKGERDEMQDEHLLIDDFATYTKKFSNVVSNDVLQCAIYGVYDGHNGCKASKYACEHVHRHLALMFPQGDCDTIENDIKKTFTEVYKKVDEEFLKISFSHRPYLRDGSTAVNVLIVNNTLYVAHIGDSKAVLARLSSDSHQMTAIPLTKDHTATDYEERTRIQKQGSVVRDGRVNGLLEVSRSFGDYQYKKQGGVISVPDVKKCRITDSDKFVILACDGLWRSFSPLEAVEFVSRVVDAEGGEESLVKRYEVACSKLASEAVLKMSGDNVTVLIVAFHV